jgi:hypothetical protein
MDSIRHDPKLGGESNFMAQMKITICPACEGGEACRTCGGTGEGHRHYEGPDYVGSDPCMPCKGTGLCPTCEGMGFIKEWIES